MNRSSNLVSLFWMALTFAVLLCVHARGEETNFYARAGADFIHAKKAANYSVGIDQYFTDRWFLRLEGGFWLDSQFLHSNAVFADIQVGFLLGNIQKWHFSLAMGPMVQSGSDYVLGSALQWTEDALIGYKNVSIGIKHISNAGLITPNLGRNQIIIQYTVPLWR